MSNTKHILSLDIPETMNRCVLRVVNTSLFTPAIPVVCPLLQVTPPGYIHPVNFDDTFLLVDNFSVNLTACDLTIQTVNCDTTLFDLPDGIYIIKYSVEPKDTTYVEYNHLRIVEASYRIKKIYCDLNLGTCDPPVNIKNTLEKVRLIQQYLYAAKAMVEDCHDPKKGMELYDYAVSSINKLACNTYC